MKLLHLPYLLACCAITLLAAPSAKAIRVIHFAETIPLLPTVSAPVGAIGTAEIELRSQNEPEDSGELAVAARGLLAGAYSIAVTMSDAAIVPLGTFTAVGGVLDAAFGDLGTALPSGLDVTSVVTVTVSDSLGVVVLMGDASSAVAQTYFAKMHLTAGPGAPGAHGTVQINSDIKKNKTSQSFKLIATGLTPSTVVTLLINGRSVGTYTTTLQGHLKIAGAFSSAGKGKSGGKGKGVGAFTALPSTVDIANIRSVSITDGFAGVLLSADI